MSEWIPSSPEEISIVPPLITMLLLEWIESSEESIVKVPPSIVIVLTALIAFALLVSVLVLELLLELFPHCPHGLWSLLFLELLFALPPPVVIFIVPSDIFTLLSACIPSLV